MRAATEAEVERWDELVKANPDGGNTLQCKAFAETKGHFGWRPRYFISEQPEVAIMALTRPTLLGELVYIPKGPGASNSQQLAELVPQLKSALAFLVKIEPDLPASDADEMKQLGLIKSPHNIQYNWATVIVDLAPSEDDIINGFRQKTRYNIRLAERKGVTVEAVEPSEDNLRQMYALMQTTTKRAGVFLRGYDYFKTFWTLHAKAGCGQLLFASYEGQVLAGAFITYLGRKALYKDGGSVREHSELQAPYLLQWSIMRWLKDHGVTEYDLHGTPPRDQLDDDSHPLAGLARFKTGFQPEVTEFVGTWDLPIDPARYNLWQRGGERLYAGLSHRIKKELFY